MIIILSLTVRFSQTHEHQRTVVQAMVCFLVTGFELRGRAREDGFASTAISSVSLYLVSAARSKDF